MRLTSLSCALTMACIFIPSKASASTDSQVWTTANATVKLSDKWRLQQEFTGRFSDNRNGLYEIESVTMLGYKMGDITIAAGYVHNPQYAGGLGDFARMERRAREQVTFDNLAKLGKAKLSARMRLEQRWRDHVDGTGWRARPYVKLSMPLSDKSKTALVLSNETFVNLNTVPFQTRTGVDRMRNFVGINFPLTKGLSGEVGYLNQHGFVRGGEDSSDHVASFSVSLSL